MARSYDAAVAALTLDVPFKWIDNLLSRHTITGVEQGVQGTTRRLSPAAIVHVAIVRILNEELEIPVRRAVEIAAAMAGANGSHPLAAGAGALTLRIDAIERRIAARLADAVESSPRPRRGRPPTRPSLDASDLY